MKARKIIKESLGALEDELLSSSHQGMDDEDVGVCASCHKAPDCDYASYNAPKYYRRNK